MADPKKPARRFLKAKLIAAAIVLLSGLIAYQGGYAGWALGHVMAKTFPRDLTLLAWLPATTTSVVIIDPHQIEPSALGSETSTVRAAIERARTDVKKLTGIDLAWDVDKLALTPELAAAHGRFSSKSIGPKLEALRYVASDYEGVTYYVRKGEDAVAIAFDEVLLYGHEDAVKRGIDAHAGESLARVESVTDRLKEVGWEHALIASVRVNDDAPSVRTALGGGGGPRAITLAATTNKAAGLSLSVVIETASPSAADDLKATLEPMARDATALTGKLGPDLGPVLAEISKGASITTSSASLTGAGGRVTMLDQLTVGQLDKLIDAAQKAPIVSDGMKSLGLFQTVAK
jgi:hypothetical protein